MSEPDMLLLDEPTTGLDPQARHILWDRLYRLKQRGVTLVLTTHYMDEAEQLCDRLVVMDGGRIVAEGSPRGLIGQHATREVLELRLHREAVGEAADIIVSKYDAISQCNVGYFTIIANHTKESLKWFSFLLGGSCASIKNNNI